VPSRLLWRQWFWVLSSVAGLMLANGGAPRGEQGEQSVPATP
jgi:hypothetical protein